MVRKVILIGFIGLLIALSNASNNKTAAVEEQTFKFDGTNVGPAITTTDVFKHKMTERNDSVENITCSNNTPIYCQSVDFGDHACIKLSGFKSGKNNKQVHVIFDNSDKKKSTPLFILGKPTLLCQNPGYTIDVAPDDFLKLVDVIEESEDERPKTGTKIYCKVTEKKKENPKSRYYIPNDSETEAKALNPFRNMKTYAFKESMQYEINCEGVATFWQRWRTWIVILGVLAAVIGVCYWFLCCDEDDDEEGKDENKAADP